MYTFIFIIFISFTYRSLVHNHKLARKGGRDYVEHLGTERIKKNSRLTSFIRPRLFVKSVSHLSKHTYFAGQVPRCIRAPTVKTDWRG